MRKEAFVKAGTDLRPWPIVPAMAGLYIVVFFMMAWKATDALMSPQFWAEDSFVFFKEQLAAAYPLVFTPYAGYLHAVPRLGAWLASVVSLPRQPLAYNLIAILAGTASVVFSVHRLSRYIPAMVVLAAFMLTPTSGEILGSLTNAQWFMQFALAILCFDTYRPAGWGTACLRVITVLCMGLSGPFSMFVAAVVAACLLVGWVMARAPHHGMVASARAFLASRDRVVLAALALTAVIQGVCIATHAPAPAAGTAHAAAWRDMLALTLTALTGLAPIHTFAESIVPSKIWFVVEALVLVAIVRGSLDARHKIVLLSLLVLAAFEVVSAAYLKPIDLMRNFGSGDRYFYLFKVTFWLTVWSACAGTVPRENRGDVTMVVMLAIALVIAANPNLLRRGALPDLQWEARARALSTPGEHVVPINPRPWTIQVSTGADGKMK